MSYKLSTLTSHWALSTATTFSRIPYRSAWCFHIQLLGHRWPQWKIAPTSLKQILYTCLEGLQCNATGSITPVPQQLVLRKGTRFHIAGYNTGCRHYNIVAQGVLHAHAPTVGCVHVENLEDLGLLTQCWATTCVVELIHGNHCLSKV